MARGVELATGYVTLAVSSSDIAPVIASQFGQIERQIAPRSGKAIGRAMAKGFESEKPDIEGLQKELQRAEEQVTATTKKAATDQEAAKRKVEIAQAKLTEAIERTGEKSARSLTALDQLRTAEQRLEAQSEAAADKQERLGKKVAEAREALEKASRGADEAEGKFSRLSESMVLATNGDFRGAFSSLVGRAKDAADDSAAQFSEGGEASGEGFIASLDGVLGGKLGSLVKGGAIAAGIAAIGKGISDGIAANIDAEVISDRIAAALGPAPGGTGEETSDRVRSVSADVYRAGYGNDVGEVSQAAGSVLSSIEGASSWSDDVLQDVTTDALNLAAVFAVDVPQSMQVAGQMLRTGLAADAGEAMDLMTVALQSVPENLRGDMLDAIEEYGPHLAAMGYSGEEAFSILASSAELGQYGIDKAGDALKEINLRAANLDDSAAQEALESLGFTGEDMANRLLEGGDVAQGATEDIINSLLEVGDPAEQARLALALFGTPLEDLTVQQIPDFLSALGDVDGGFATAEGAADQLDSTLNDNLGTRIAELRRGFEGLLTDAMTPVVGWIMDEGLPGLGALGDGARAMWEESVGPAFSEAWAFIRDDLGPVFTEFWEDRVQPVFTLVGDIVSRVWNSVLAPILNLLAGTFTHVLGPALSSFWHDIVSPVFGWIVDRTTGLWDSISPIFDAFALVLSGDLPGAADALWQAFRETFTWIGNLIGDVLRVPVNFLIGTIWNGGIVSVINTVSDALGLDWHLDPVDEIPPFFGVSAPAGPGSAGGPRPLQAFAKGGLPSRGWALVGEEGPELINVDRPARVYTAAETAAALAAGEDLSPELERRAIGATPAESLVPAGGNLWDAVTGTVDWIGDRIGDAISWTRGRLADAAELVLDPISELIFGQIEGYGLAGQVIGGTGRSIIDAAIDWIRGQDADYAESMGGMGEIFGGVVSGMSRPSSGGITSRYGPRWGSFHAGIDLAGGAGGRTYAAMDGVVSKIGWNVVGGRTGIGIVLNHGDRGWTYYGHNPSLALPVAVGQTVRAGQHIGFEGSTGNVTGSHLHFEYWPSAYGQAVNPLQLGIFDKGGLLPHGEYAVNLSGSPERVLSPEQTEAFDRLVSSQITGVGAGPQFHINYLEPRASAEDIIREARMQLRHFERGGVSA